MRSFLTLSVQLFSGSLREQPFKWLISVMSISVGVAMGYCVHVIHQHALSQFELGVRQFSGRADAQIVPHQLSIPDHLVERLHAVRGLTGISPVVQTRVGIVGLEAPVDWVGVDVFQAAGITPGLIGKPFELRSKQVSGQSSNPDDQPNTLSLLGSEEAFISPALMEKLRPHFGDTPVEKWIVEARLGDKISSWHVAGTLPAAGAGALLVASDIAAAQWKLGEIGQISRVDLRLAQGTSIEAIKTELEKTLAGAGRIETPSDQVARGSAVSQAYRANLSILAMVALLTGGFLSFSTQMLAVAHRSRQWALLASIGMSIKRLRLQVLTEALLAGLTGGILGVVIGHILATAIVNRLGTDLGAGYFSQQAAEVSLHWPTLLGFVGFGAIATVAGGIFPSTQVARIALSRQLRAGTEEAGLQFANRAPKWVLALLVCSGLALLIPPQGSGIPLGGYVSIACGLFGGIASIGWVVQRVLRAPPTITNFNQLGMHRLAATPNLVAVGLAGVVASFSLVVAMHVMIFSFRASLDRWLEDVLPAPVYVRVKHSGTQWLDSELQANLSRAEQVGKSEFWGTFPIQIDPRRPAVEMIVRPMPNEQARSKLPLTTASTNSLPDELTPIWVSEPMADIYGLRIGQTMQLQLDGQRTLRTAVAGIWRDYARQHGAFVVDSQELKKATQIELKPTQAAFWPKAGASDAQMLENLRQIASHSRLKDQVDWAQSSEIRAISLRIFDRSFAVTYLLEFAAVVIGLFGVATSFSAMTLPRRREFATLQALGATRQQIRKLLFSESLLSSCVAVGMGLTMGLAFAAVLVFVVNPQSFHWTLQWFMPWRDLLIMSAVVVLAASLTQTLAMGQHGDQSRVLSMLKEDWS